MDKIIIKDISVEAIIGCLPKERTHTQLLIIHAILFSDLKTVAAFDDIEKAVNYKLVVEDIIAFVTDSEFALIETMALNLAQMIKSKYSVEKVIITVEKPNALTTATVAVEMEV